jgi:HD superfamily phosphohydrolase
MAEFKRQRIRDPLHDLIEFDEGDGFESMLWRVVQTAPFQRLRRIRQLGFSELVYPGATHTRFAHSLGVFHTARQLMRIVDLYAPRTPEERIQREAALVASLVHDVGHGPFSHAFEAIGERFGWSLVADHEQHSDLLIRSTEQGGIGEVLNGYRPGFADVVADVLRRGPETIYGSIVSSQFDADRLDYIRRDGLMTGTRLARVDFEWLLANLEIGELPRQAANGPEEAQTGQLPRPKTLVLGPKAIYAAESFLVGLFQMYPTVYLHKTTRGAEKLARFVLERVATLFAKEETATVGLPQDHPLAVFFKNPNSSRALSDLDDTVVYSAFSTLRTSRDPLIANFSTRLLSRRLFKSIDLLAMARPDLPREGDEAYEKAVTRFRGVVEGRIDEWRGEGADREGRILFDFAERKIYKKMGEEPSLNDIWIREGGNLVRLRERSGSVRAIGTFFGIRAYVDEGDEEAHRFVEECVSTAAKGEAS